MKKAALFSLLINLLILTPIYCDWMVKSGQVGSEKYAVSFPKEPTQNPSSNNHTLYSMDDSRVMYMLTTSKAPITHDIIDAVQVLISSNNKGDKKVTHQSISKEGNKTILDLETYNSKTKGYTKNRYYITKSNVWQLKTVYENPKNEKHSDFVKSFSVE